MSRVVAPDTYVGQSVVEPASLAWACLTQAQEPQCPSQGLTHSMTIQQTDAARPGVPNTCAMTPARRSLSTQRIDSGTAHQSIKPAATGLIHDLHLDHHYTHLRTRASHMNRVLVEPTRNGTQSCLYDIVAAFVEQPMTHVRRDLGAWHLLPAKQARLCDILPTNLQSPSEWIRQSRSLINTYSLANECDIYSLALLFDVYFQILSSTTSVHHINIQGTRGMIIGHVNSKWVKHFVATKLLRNVDNVFPAVTHATVEVPASHQNGTQSKRRKLNVPPNPAVLLDTWPDCLSSGVAFGSSCSLSYQSMSATDSLPHANSRCVTLDVVNPSNPQGQGVVEAVSTPLHTSPTPAPPGSVPTHLEVGSVPHVSACVLSGPHTLVGLGSMEGISVKRANGGSQDLNPTAPSRPNSLSTLTQFHSTHLSHPLQSLQSRVSEHFNTTVSALSQSPDLTLLTLITGNSSLEPLLQVVGLFAQIHIDLS